MKTNNHDDSAYLVRVTGLLAAPWRRYIGTDVIPVTTAIPVHTEFSPSAYPIDFARFSDEQFKQFMREYGKQCEMSYQELFTYITSFGLAIDSSHATLIQPRMP